MKSTIQSDWAAVVLAVAAVCATPAHAQDANAIRGMAATCANCHGTNGRSSSAIPGLAGLDKGYIIGQMQDFKSGKRASTIMQQLARGFSDAQIDEIAGYFAAQLK
jgi:cytochrome c553